MIICYWVVFFFRGESYNSLQLSNDWRNSETVITARFTNLKTVTGTQPRKFQPEIPKMLKHWESQDMISFFGCMLFKYFGLSVSPNFQSSSLRFGGDLCCFREAFVSLSLKVKRILTSNVTKLRTAISTPETELEENAICPVAFKSQKFFLGWFVCQTNIRPVWFGNECTSAVWLTCTDFLWYILHDDKFNLGHRSKKYRLVFSMLGKINVTCTILTDDLSHTVKMFFTCSGTSSDPVVWFQPMCTGHGHGGDVIEDKNCC